VAAARLEAGGRVGRVGEEAAAVVGAASSGRRQGRSEVVVVPGGVDVDVGRRRAGRRRRLVPRGRVTAARRRPATTCSLTPDRERKCAENYNERHNKFIF